jgi:hypothetical protein
MESNIDIVKILGYGLSGFAFLLLFMAYNLIHTEQKRDGNPRGGIIKLIIAFMSLDIIAIVVVGILGIPALRDNQMLNKNLTVSQQKVDELGHFTETQNKLIATLADTTLNSPRKLHESTQQIASSLDSLASSISISDTSQKAVVSNLRKTFAAASDKLMLNDSNTFTRDSAQHFKTSLVADYNKAYFKIKESNSKYFLKK